MKNKTKKIMSVILSTLIILSLFALCSTISFAADAKSGIMKSYAPYKYGNNIIKPYETDDYHAYKSNVVSITFLTEIDDDAIAECGKLAWDVSAAGDGSVMAWMILNEEKTTEVGTDRYDVYIGATNGPIANRNSRDLFCNFTILETINGLECFDTSNTTSMYYMFAGCSSLTELDVSNFDTSNVTNIASMFNGCSNLISLDVSNFDTSNVTDIHYMFGGCSTLTNLDVTGFDTSKVTDMSFMFDDCSNLTSLDVSNFDTSNVTNMEYMFCTCSSLTSLDLSSFNTSNVTDMGAMFYNCSGLTSLDLSNFDTSNVTSMGSMFYNCSNLTSLDLSNFDTSSVTNMYSMFKDCSELTTLDVSNFDTSNVTNMKSTFENCSNLTELNLSSFDTSNVTTMQTMFRNCSKLKKIYVGDDWSISNVKCNGVVTDPCEMFYGCYLLKGKDSYQNRYNYYNHSQGVNVSYHGFATTEYYMTHIDPNHVPEDSSSTNNNDNNNAPKLNFFEQLIQMIKDFFAKLFGG